MNIIQLLTDPENQPHQYVGNPLGLKSVLYKGYGIARNSFLEDEFLKWWGNRPIESNVLAAFKAGANLCAPDAAPEGWVSVEDRLPQSRIEFALVTSYGSIPQIAEKAIMAAAPQGPSPYEQMVTGNHAIGIFKDGKLIAADRDVYAAPQAEREPVRYAYTFEDGIGLVEPVKNGPYVRFTDYDALSAKLAECRRERDYAEQKFAHQEIMLKGATERASQSESRAAAAEKHISGDGCGFDRNGSHNAGHYVCTCGWEDAALSRRKRGKRGK